jgi:hypothetical protein
VKCRWRSPRLTEFFAALKETSHEQIIGGFLIGLGMLLGSSTGYAWDDCSNSQMQIYDAAFDFLPGFTAGKNPNGCWTYGWTMNLSGVLHIFPTAGISPLDNNLSNGLTQATIMDALPP